VGIADKVKDSVSLRAVVERDGVAWDMRRSSVSRGDWWRPCPFHAEATPSFHVVEPRGTHGFFKCFGCDAGGSVIDFVALRDGVEPGEAIRRLAADAGVAPDEDPAAARRRREDAEDRRVRSAEEERRDAERKRARAKLYWREATPHVRELRDYLAVRGVNVDALSRLYELGVPPTLRYAPRHPYYAPGHREPVHVGPAMLGFIGRSRFHGVHQTWIGPEGRACDAEGRKLSKKWLGETGDLYGHPVRLSKSAPALVVGEGIETALAMFGELVAAGREGWACEAALSLGALAGPQAAEGRGPDSRTTGRPLPSAKPDLGNPRGGWFPPEGVFRVVVLGEGSEKDPEAAERHGRRAVAKLAATGCAVRLAMPGDGWGDGRDFADLARADAAAGARS
jgi:hypothetical protein